MRTRWLLASLVTAAVVAAFIQQPASAGVVTGASSPQTLGTWSSPVRVLSGPSAGLSCSSPRFCTAVSYDGTAAQGHGRTWEASQAFCAAVGYVFTLTWNGASWRPAKLDLKTNLTSVSCASTTFCAATDEQGRAFEWDGTGWSAGTEVIPDGGYPSEVSCPSAAFCAMAASRTGVVSTFDGSAWSHPERIDDAAPRDVSCPTSTFCTVLDTKGFVLNLHRAP